MTVPALATRPRSVHVERCMGTVFTLDIRDPGIWHDAINEVVTWLHHVDSVFSTYRPDSDISRMRRRELRMADAAPDMARVLDLCAEIQLETSGYFTAVPNGMIDPTGLVKGWAVEQASAILRAHGSVNHAVNGGGDIQLAGAPAAGRPWRVGITDPRNRSRIVTVVSAHDLAVATSGTAERGGHILDPFTGRPCSSRASVTVIGPSLTRADSYATAAFVMDAMALPWIESRSRYELLLIDADGAVTASSGWPGTSA